MSAITDMIDSIGSRVNDKVEIVKKKIFGANNEHLDFVMDSFYKLAPTQRQGVLAGIIGAIILVIFGTVLIYLNRVQALQDELNQSYSALHEMKVLKSQFQAEEARFNRLVDQVGRKANNVRVKPFFEKLAKDLNITLEGLSDKRVDFPTENPLSKSMKEVRVEMRVSKVSIPRLLTFLIEIEKAGYFLSVQDLQIRGRYGTKLFFDAQIKVRGYNVTR